MDWFGVKFPQHCANRQFIDYTPYAPFRLDGRPHEPFFVPALDLPWIVGQHKDFVHPSYDPKHPHRPLLWPPAMSGSPWETLDDMLPPEAELHVEACARLRFADGSYFMTTPSLCLGRHSGPPGNGPGLACLDVPLGVIPHIIDWKPTVERIQHVLPSPFLPLRDVFKTVGDVAPPEHPSARTISRRHANIAWDSFHSAYVLTVLGRNGLCVIRNDVPAFLPSTRSIVLQDLDEIRIGKTGFIFMLPPPPPPPPVNPGASVAQELLAPVVEEPQAQHPGKKARLEKHKENAQKRRERPRFWTPELLRAFQHLKPPPAMLGTPIPPFKPGPGRPPKDHGISAKDAREMIAAFKVQNPQYAPLEHLQAVSSSENHSSSEAPATSHNGSPFTAGINGNPPTEEFPAADYPRPSMGMVDLVREALARHGGNPVPLATIYQNISNKHPYFRKKDSSGWQSTVRHTLNDDIVKGGNNFNKFAKEGKGSSWALNPAVPANQQAFHTAQHPPSSSGMAHGPASAPNPAPQQALNNTGHQPTPGGMAHGSVTAANHDHQQPLRNAGHQSSSSGMPHGFATSSNPAQQQAFPGAGHPPSSSGMPRRFVTSLRKPDRPSSGDGS